MMELENIKQMLGEAYNDDVENAIKVLVEGAMSGGTGYVPQVKYNQVKGLYDELLTKQANFESWEAEKNSLTQKVNELQTAYAELQTDSEAKLQAIKNQNLFERKLDGYKPKNSKCVEALIDKDKLSYKDDEIEGLQEQMDLIKKDNPYLFEQEPTGTGMPHDASALKQSTSPLEDEQLRKYFGLDNKK